MDEVERTMIDLYKPKYNIKLKSPQPIATEMTLTIGAISVPFNQRPSVAKFERRI